LLSPIPPPEGFRPAGLVRAAFFVTEPTFRKRKYTGRRLEGVRYERRVHEHLAQAYGDRYVPSPWLRFLGETGWRFCQPDGLLFDFPRGRITVVEVKYQHTADAWWQVRHLYLPVLQKLFPPHLWAFDFCEVVKWYDPATLFPERTVLAQEVCMAHPAFKVHIWRP